MQQPEQSPRKTIEITSDYYFYDLFSNKKYHDCSVRIPETVLLQKGFFKDWFFNSSKITGHPILKKKKQNLLPLTFLKSLCQKMGYGSVVANVQTTIDLRNEVINMMKQKKDYQFVKEKKSIEIITIDNEQLQLSLIDFLNMVAQNKYSDQLLSDKWKIIQERVNFNKIQEYYQVDSVRKNHLIQSKCHKLITVPTGFASMSSRDLSEDQFSKVSPTKQVQVAETKTVEGYKFFDTFLNKKFFQSNQAIIQAIQKNCKCIVEILNVSYVINKERQPFLKGISNLVIKPNKKIMRMRDFQPFRQQGQIKLDDYNRFLYLYITDYLDKQQRNVYSSPIQKRKCKGDFCDCQCINLPAHLQLLDSKSRLPAINNTARKISLQMIQTVKKRQGRVIQKMKQCGFVNPNYTLKDEQSSQYEEDEQTVKLVKVCENCFTFYSNVSKIYDFDNFQNLIEKKHPLGINIKSSKKETRRHNSQKILPPELQNFQHIKKQVIDRNLANSGVEGIKLRNRVNSSVNIKHKKQQNQSIQPKIKQKQQNSNLQRSESAQPKRLLKSNPKSKLDPLRHKLNQFQKKITQRNVDNKNQQSKSSSIMNLSKINQPVKMAERVKQKKIVVSKPPQSYQQASQQLIQKLKKLPSSSEQQFVFTAKKYYTENLPQYVERKCFSSEYGNNIYEFFNNSPLNLAPPYRIKKRPQMTLKRLSEHTSFPQIVSKSAFIFDTLILDETTTISFCIITSKMIGNADDRTKPFENIIVVNDIFDSFIEYIPLAKTSIQEHTNKRIILFNRPGQSHTIYDQKQLQLFPDFVNVMEKLLYRLSSQKDQLKIINFQKDYFKFIGIGYGGHLLASYLGSYHQLFENIRGIFLINVMHKLSEKYIAMLQNLLQLYQSGQPTSEELAFLYYSKAIQSSQNKLEDMERKASLNSIRIQDRIYLIKSILMDKNSNIIRPFEQIQNSPVHLLYGLSNCIVTKNQSKSLSIFNNVTHTITQDKKSQISIRKFFQAEGGHDLLADNYEEMQYRFEQFARMSN